MGGNWDSNIWKLVMELKFSNLDITLNFWDMVFFFACVHNFYRFQNNFQQHRVLVFFINFQGVVFYASPGFSLVPQTLGLKGLRVKTPSWPPLPLAACKPVRELPYPAASVEQIQIHFLMIPFSKIIKVWPLHF